MNNKHFSIELVGETHIVSKERWEDLFFFVDELNKQTEWARVKLVDIGRQWHSLEDMAQQLGRSEKTLKNWLTVYWAFQNEEHRVDGLSFSHHAAVASIARDNMEEAHSWLNEALAQGWSEDELRGKLRESSQDEGFQPLNFDTAAYRVGAKVQMPAPTRIIIEGEHGTIEISSASRLRWTIQEG